MDDVKQNYSHEKLAQVIEEQGRRLDWLAEQLGYTPSYISKLKSGSKPITEEIAVRLAEALNVSVIDLVADQQEVAA